MNGTDWNLEARLKASDGASGDQFGCSVSISEFVVVIGAYSVVVDSLTAVHLFDVATWNEVQWIVL